MPEHESVAYMLTPQVEDSSIQLRLTIFERDLRAIQEFLKMNRVLGPDEDFLRDNECQEKWESPYALLVLLYNYAVARGNGDE